MKQKIGVIHIYDTGVCTDSIFFCFFLTLATKFVGIKYFKHTNKQKKYKKNKKGTDVLVMIQWYDQYKSNENIEDLNMLQLFIIAAIGSMFFF